MFYDNKTFTVNKWTQSKKKNKKSAAKLKKHYKSDVRNKYKRYLNKFKKLSNEKLHKNEIKWVYKQVG